MVRVEDYAIGLGEGQNFSQLPRLSCEDTARQVVPAFLHLGTLR